MKIHIPTPKFQPQQFSTNHEKQQITPIFINGRVYFWENVVSLSQSSHSLRLLMWPGLLQACMKMVHMTTPMTISICFTIMSTRKYQMPIWIPKVLKYRKVTRPGIEPRTFWTYTRCSNQLSYLALEFNQFRLYLC